MSNDVTAYIDGTLARRNGSLIVGAPRGTTTSATNAFSGPLASGYRHLPGSSDDMVVKGSVGGVNDAAASGYWYGRYTNRLVYASGYPYK